MLIVVAFGTAWAALLLLAMWTRSRMTVRTVAALLVNWALQLIFYGFTGLATAWWFFLPLDALTARYILRQPRGRLQGFVSFVLLVQIAMHAGYGISDLLNGYSWDAESKYWTILTMLAAVQALGVGGGLGGGSIVHVYRRFVRRDSMVASPHDLAGAGGGR